MDAQTHCQGHPTLPRQARIELLQGFHDPQPGTYGALRIVLVRQGITKVDQQPIAEVLGDMPLKTLDDGGAGLLISSHYLAQLFRVQTRRQRCRVDQITEQHSQLAPFGLRCLTPGRCWANRYGLVYRRVWWLCRLEG